MSAVIWWAVLLAILGGFVAAVWKMYDWESDLRLLPALGALVAGPAAPIVMVHIYDQHWRASWGWPTLWLSLLVGVPVVLFTVKAGSDALDYTQMSLWQTLLGFAVPLAAAIGQFCMLIWFISEAVDAANRALAPITVGGLLVVVLLIGGFAFLNSTSSSSRW